ncbi:MAG: FIST C-terminal domain-containing protein [Bacteroidia bacterium]|nr:FIST C-terminal domain-containing protein [Bacteroidia bacterium]
MLQFFSASTNIVNSKRAITECIENALQGEPDLNCDLIIIYTQMGHNFKDLITEAHKLSPSARIAGCTCAGVIGKSGSDESMTAMAIMAIKGSKNEFVLTNRKTTQGIDQFKVAAEMAQELKDKNPGINGLLFLPSIFEWLPFDQAMNGINSVFTHGVCVFGGVAMDNFKMENCYHFLDDEVIERGALMIGFADPTLRYISKANHGFSILEGMPFVITKSKSGIIYELDGKPAWQLLTETLGVPETIKPVELNAVTLLAKELPHELHEEYGSKYVLNGIGSRNEDGSINGSWTWHDGMKIWMSKRDEKKIMEGVDIMIKYILEELQDKKPLAVFHADCVLRGKFSLNRILKDELINRLQYPICKGENIPWLGLYSGGEFTMLGGKAWLGQASSALCVIYR